MLSILETQPNAIPIRAFPLCGGVSWSLYEVEDLRLHVETAAGKNVPIYFDAP
jgi:hypothetical protein